MRCHIFICLFAFAILSGVVIKKSSGCSQKLADLLLVGCISMFVQAFGRYCDGGIT